MLNPAAGPSNAAQATTTQHCGIEDGEALQVGSAQRKLFWRTPASVHRCCKLSTDRALRVRAIQVVAEADEVAFCAALQVVRCDPFVQYSGA